MELSRANYKPGYTYTLTEFIPSKNRKLYTMVYTGMDIFRDCGIAAENAELTD